MWHPQAARKSPECVELGICQSPIIAERSQLPEFFGNMCKGDAHGLSDRLMMPISSIVLNSALATASLSGGNLRALAYTGGPVVVMKFSTPWRTEGLANSGRVIAGNSSSIRLYGSSEVMWCRCRAGSSD